MKFHYLLLFLSGIILALNPTLGWTQNDDNLILAAHSAWENNDKNQLALLLKATQKDDLHNYVEYWYWDVLLNHHELPPTQPLIELVAPSNHFPFRIALAEKWLIELARQNLWLLFSQEMKPEYTQNPILECDVLSQKILAPDPDLPREIRAVWFSQQYDPETCDKTFRTAYTLNYLSRNDVWEAIHQSLFHQNITLTHYLNSYLPPGAGIDEDLLSTIESKPQTLFEQSLHFSDTTVDHEMVEYALLRLAHQNPKLAAQYWQSPPITVSAIIRDSLWAKIAQRGAQLQMPEALDWFHQIHTPILTETELAWKIRLLIQNKQWAEALLNLQNLPPTMAQESVWRYWQARVLAQTGHKKESIAIKESLSHEWNYYGLLALEELGHSLQLPDPNGKPSPPQMEHIQPLFSSSLRLHNMNLNQEAIAQWHTIFKTLTAEEQQTATQLATDSQWFNIAIDSEVHGLPPDNKYLRYPIPHQEMIERASQESSLSPAWVYALMRQESWFDPNAISQTGALGLMQLMPSTARWIARTEHLPSVKNQDLSDLQLNVTLGTLYLKHLNQLLGDSTLATMAYNAGPNRTRSWDNQWNGDGTIFLESIPLQETRQYVQNILFNTRVYELLLHEPSVPLHRRINILESHLNQPVTPVPKNEP
jgi:soluble lytic murein transglycosylase